MALTPGDTCLQACPNCAALVDISDQEPLSKFHCPMCGTAMRANRQYNHFAIVEALGQGGMGTVYKALDRNLNRLVALKLLRRELSADENYILKLEDEARITASINHPYVVKVFSFGSDQGQYYIAMELVDKGTLDDLMQLQNRIAELQVLQVGLQVASGLQAAHERGLIHRDVKPGNILFADAHTAKITDFGLALLAEHEADARGEIWGTPYYIAPEKLNNEPEDFRSDIYSLGGTLFHAVAGRPPFEAESASLVALKHLKSRAVSLQAFAPDVSSETAYVINRMLHKDPNQRYGSYGELIDHFRYAIDTLTAKSAKPRAARPRVVVESQNQSKFVGLLTLLLLLLILVGGALAFHYRNQLAGGDPANPAPPPTAPAALTADARATVEAAYEDARHEIVSGQYADAQESFRTLLQRTDLTQPLLNWARLHYGMTALLSHQLADARAIFGTLQRAGLFSKAPADHDLANFFPETGRFLADAKNVPAAAAIKAWNKDTHEDLSLVLFGLKDWEQGDFEDAAKLFEAYLSGKPPAPYQWMADYEPIARKCVHDYGLYAPLLARRLAGKDDPAALQAAFTQARGQLQTTGRIVEAFFSAETDLAGGNVPAALAADTSPAATATPTPGPTPTPVPTAASMPALSKAAHDAETIRWQTARESYEQMVALNRFDEAQAVLDHVQLADPDYRNAHDLVRLRVGRLIAFKRMLINDINSHGGYPKPVFSRRGNSYPRGIQQAATDSLQAGTPYGTISVPWTDFSPPSILAMAAYYIDATSSPSQAADRRWLAANYALESGQLNDARALAARAAQAKPEYQKDLEQFTRGVGAAAPLPPGAQAP